MTTLVPETTDLAPISQLNPSGILKNFIVGKYSTICISFPDSSTYRQYNNVEEIVFTYQLEELEEKEFLQKEPQLKGTLYPKTIKVNSKVAFISHKDGTFNKLSLNLNSLRGFPKMYVYKCDTYPLCGFEKEKLTQAIRPRNINRFSSYNVKKEEGYDDSPISKKQTLFVVECVQAEKEYREQYPFMDTLCDFNTLISEEKTAIKLKEENFFNQYALLNEVHNYKIELGKETGIEKVFIDIMTYVGDVEINMNEITSNEIQADQYDSVNKIFISVKTNGRLIEDLNFSVKGLNNTYYTILVTFARNKNDEDSFITNILQSGMSYLVTVDYEKYSSTSGANKIIKFRNERMIDGIPFLTNFYSLNCEISISFNKENEQTPIHEFEHFFHDIISSSQEKQYYSNSYDYKITVKTPDPSEYKGNLCKIYASAIEISGNHNDYTRDILIPDNTPQQIMLGGVNNHISFGYIHVDFHNDLLIKFNLKHTAKYKVQLYYENHVRNQEEVTIVADNLLYLSATEWSEICRDNSRVCYIQLDITLEQTKDHENPLLEVSMKSIGSHFVDYIPKNHLKIDYVQNNIPQYYYTELGRNEDGFIILNFLRGSGKVVARIVDKTSSIIENKAVWRGKYRLPSEEEIKDLKMDSFTKKLPFHTYGESCADGCYLIISVFSDVKSVRIDFEKGRNFPYSIIVQSYPNTINYLKIPTIRIPLDEYVVGSVNPSYSHRILQFYSVWLNKDADFVAIDWQSDGGSLFIKVGEEKPIVDDHHLNITGIGKDYIRKFSKNEILRCLTESPKVNSLKDIVLTLGVWTELIDSIYTTPFSFAVRLENKDEDNVYRVNSDQKVLCRPNKIKEEENKFRCVFGMNYYYISKYAMLYIYANLQDKTASFNIYSKYTTAADFEMSTKEQLKNLIPTKSNYDKSTEQQKKDYIFLSTETEIDRYVLVSVEVNKETTIELVSTIFLFQDEITPNPSTYQLMTTYNKFDINLNFPREYMEMINIICVGGSGILYWNDSKDKQYYLKGRDDRISITSTKSNNAHQLTIIGYDDDFVVIVEYNIRADLSNFDSLNLEKSVNYIYTNSDFPISLYCPLITFDMEGDDYYDIFFSFYNLETTEEKPLTYYESYSFTAHGFIVKESVMYDAKLSPDLTPEVNADTIFGFYDAGVRAGLIRVKSSKIVSTGNQYLLLKFDKSDQFRDVRKYKSISLETGVYHKNSKTPSSELSNQYGYLNINQSEAIYILRNDKSKTYLNLEFSCEDDNVIAHTDKNLKFEKQQYGKNFYSIETKDYDEFINLKLERNKEKGEEYLQFFFFRYTFSDQAINSKYSINNTKINVTQTYNERTSNYLIELTPINDYNKYNVTYIVRIITDRAKPSNPYVSIKIGIQNVKEFYNPTPKEKKLSFNVTDASYRANYIQVIVQIREKEDVECLSYDLQDNFTEINPPDDKNNNKNKDNKINNNNKTLLIVGIVVGSILVIIIIVLVVVILIFNNKNKDLLEKVNKVSFADNEGRGGDDDLLLSKE